MDCLDADACYRALRTRDARFDGRLFVGVRTTGIYCRPICPARTPKLENCRFFPSAAAAQEAGFRPCLRCRPESSPDLAAWRGTSSTVARALALDRRGRARRRRRDVEALARRLGIGERQLRRLFHQHLGASPIAVAQTRRVLFAKQLIHETRMRITDVAFAAGFGSVRRFNATFRGLYRASPGAARASRRRRRRLAARSPAITLKLQYAPPYDWHAMIAFLAARAIAGVEEVLPDVYRRTIGLDGARGRSRSRRSGRGSLAVTIRFPNLRALPTIVARIRRVFDLGADVSAINAQLAADPQLAALVAARPGLRVPGAWDGFELAVRAVLGQQITVTAARKLAGRLVAPYGEPLRGLGQVADARLPDAGAPGGTDPRALGMPRSRRDPRVRLARPSPSRASSSARPTSTRRSRASARSPVSASGRRSTSRCGRSASPTRSRPPTSDCCARWPTRRPAAPSRGFRDARRRWRPWRAYAAQHLWTSDPTAVEVAHGCSSLPRTDVVSGGRVAPGRRHQRPVARHLLPRSEDELRRRRRRSPARPPGAAPGAHRRRGAAAAYFAGDTRPSRRCR